LQNTIAPYANNGFFYLNVIGMKRQLLKLPWVYAVSIQRKWPDAIVVNIIEQQAVLRWGAESLVNHKGVVFTPPSSTFPEDLPVISGPKERELEIFDLYRKAQRMFEPLDLSIERLSFDQQKYWEIVFNNGMVVYLKENDPLGQLGLLTELYRRITAGHEGPPKSIDLRYNTDGLAVKW
jgi:cell division protein FtsQ